MEERGEGREERGKERRGVEEANVAFVLHGLSGSSVVVVN